MLQRCHKCRLTAKDILGPLPQQESNISPQQQQETPVNQFIRITKQTQKKEKITA